MNTFLDQKNLRFHSLAPMYYRGAQAAIVVYDITSAVKLFSFYFYQTIFFNFFQSAFI